MTYCCGCSPVLRHLNEEKKREEITMQKRNDSDELEISISGLLWAMWDIRLIIIGLAIAGGILGLLLSSGGTTVYETRASMLVTARNAAGTYRDGSDYPVREDMLLAENLAKTVQLLASSDRVLAQVIGTVTEGRDETENTCKH